MRALPRRHRMASTEGRTGRGAQEGTSMAATHDTSSIEGRTRLLARVSRRLHRFFCGLRGHELIVKFEPDRIRLQCVCCPHESPGWNLASRERANGPRGDK